MIARRHSVGVSSELLRDLRQAQTSVDTARVDKPVRRCGQVAKDITRSACSRVRK